MMLKCLFLILFFFAKSTATHGFYPSQAMTNEPDAFTQSLEVTSTLDETTLTKRFSTHSSATTTQTETSTLEETTTSKRFSTQRLDVTSTPKVTTISKGVSSKSATTVQANAPVITKTQPNTAKERVNSATTILLSTGNGSGTSNSVADILAGRWSIATCVGGALLLITVAVILHRIFREKNKKNENPVPEVHFQAHAAETSMNADSAQYENVKKTEQYENVVKSGQYENFSSTQHYEKIDSVTIRGVTGPYEIFEAGVSSGAPTSNTPSA